MLESFDLRMGVHGNVNKKKKDLVKKRLEHKEAARRAVAKKILASEGKSATSQAVRSTIKDFQQTNQRLQSRISKKKERKNMKSLLRKEKESTKMDLDIVPSKKRNVAVASFVNTNQPKNTDVEMSS